MPQRTATFLGLMASPHYRRPIMHFRLDNGRPRDILLPEGETMPLFGGEEVEFFFERNVWTMIRYQGQIIVRNPRAGSRPVSPRP